MKAGFKTASRGHAAEASKSNDPARSRTARALGAPVLQLQPELGNQAIQWLFRSGALHPKLAVGSADDPLEKEADRISDHVMRAPALSLRRKCACGGPSGADGECEECRNKRMEDSGETPVVRRRAEKSAGPSEAPSIVHEALGSPGRPLDSATRADMEGRFGVDFGDVRIHTDRRAAESAKAVDALAYTVGSNIAFGERQYDPHSDAGRRLLAHELAHVAQQRGSDDGTVRRQPEAAGAPTPAPDASPPAPAPNVPTPTPAPDASPPAQTAPTPSVPAASVAYDGPGLSPVERGTPLSPDPMKIHDLLGQMIAEHGVSETWRWVTALDDWVMREEQKLRPAGDSSGALPGPESPPVIKQIVGIFQRERDTWRDYLGEVEARLENALIDKTYRLLDKNKQQVLIEAQRYGIRVEGEGPQPPAIPGLSLPLGPERERGGVRKAARDLVVLWEHKIETQKTMEALLTPPRDLIDLDKQFHERRRYIISQYPILAAYARDLDALRSFANQDDPTESLRIEMNKTLIKIGEAREGARGHLLPAMVQEPALRAGAKKDIGVAENSPEDRAIEDNAAALVAAEQDLATLKEVLSIGLLLASVIPGVAPIAGAVGLALGAADIIGSFQDYLWEEAASGSAFDKAFAISQSDPSLLRLGVEIAVGLGAGVVAGAVIKEAAEAFKTLAPLVRKAAAARLASAAGRKAVSAPLASAAEEEAAMARLKEAAGPELGNRLQAAIDSGEFDVAEAGVGESKTGEPGAELPNARELGWGRAELQSAPAPRYRLHIVSTDPESGDVVGLVIDDANQPRGTFRINRNTGDGVVAAWDHRTGATRTRAIVAGVVQPERAALPSATGSLAAPAAPGAAPAGTGSTPTAIGAASPADPQAKALPGAGLPPGTPLSDLMLAPEARAIPGTPGVVLGGKSQVLGRNLMRAFGLPPGTRFSGWQPHHIIPSEARTHPVIVKIGMNLDAPSNGIMLPEPATPGGGTLPTHRGYHALFSNIALAELDKIDVSLPVPVLELRVFGLQQRLRLAILEGTPLYASQGGSIMMWQSKIALPVPR